jgi:adenylosuccinate synthase
LASRCPEHTAIMRFNGGGQAGHTVVTPDSRRHVFSHFCSASFLSCPSYLSRYFIVNPIVFAKEYAQLASIGVTPTTFIDENSMLTTPVDIFINQYMESKRGHGRHGSCGLGINETVTRSLRSASLASRSKEALNSDAIAEKLDWLFEFWLPKRLEELGIKELDQQVESFCSKKKLIIERFNEDLAFLRTHSFIGFQDINRKKLIFEGAQGLLLDEDRLDQYPHLTRSKTGLFNVLRLAKDYEIDHLETTYVTRSYLTRHGAGPLKGESSIKFPDLTNVNNQFQGNLRFAPLDWEELAQRIQLDFNQAKYSFANLEANIAVTCLDQMPLTDSLKLPFKINFESYGPCRDQVRAALSLKV